MKECNSCNINESDSDPNIDAYKVAPEESWNCNQICT